MRIGIAGPIGLFALKDYLELEDKYISYGLEGTAINNLIIGLLQEGHKVSVYTLDPRISSAKVFKGSNLKVYMGQYRPKGRSRMMDFFRHESSQIKNFIVEDKPDIVHAHWSYEFAVGAIDSKYPHLITFRDDAWTILKIQKDLYRLIRFLIDKWVRIKGTNFSVTSPYMQKLIKISDHDLPIIPNSIQEELIKVDSKTLPTGRPIRIVSIINGWNKRKNPIPGIKAFNKLMTEAPISFEYHIYGRDFSEKDASYLWLKNNNLEKNIFLHGEIPHKELMKNLSDFDILLHPSVEESFGNNLIEAMGSGLPVVAGKDAGAVPWVLNEGKNGILVDVKSEISILEGLLTLIKNPDLYEKLSKDGIKRVEENFSSSSVTRQYIDLYCKILKK